MKNSGFIALLVGFVALAATLQSCKKDTVQPPQEFIADNSSFAGFMSWSLDKTNHGPDPLLGAMAHANNDSTVTRDVFFKNGQNPVNTKYPVGTLIVKHSHNPGGSVNEFTAMAKRGNQFNPNVGDWEFFMLTSTGAIAADSAGAPMRGAMLMSGMCGSCHSTASAKDFIFSK